MCLIIHREAGDTTSKVPQYVLDYNKYSNPDGFGLAWREPDGLKYEKFGASPDDYRAFETLLKVIDATDYEYVAHFRKATHGPVCKELSHPFPYEDPKQGEVLVFHNGIIGIDIEKGESDTSQFVKTVLSNMDSSWWKKPAYRYLVENSIGWSRLLIMTENETVRLRAKDWQSEDGIFYSCQPAPPSLKSYPAKESYEAFGLTGDDDDDEYDYIAGVGVAAKNMKLGSEWKHAGHWVAAESYNKDEFLEEEYGFAKCRTCGADGEWYIVDGATYTEMDHGMPKKSRRQKRKERRQARLQLLTSPG